MNGLGLRVEAEFIEATGAVDEKNLVILWMKDLETKTLCATFVLAPDSDNFPVKVFCSEHSGHIGRTRF